jgi:hypothetical protein
MKYTVLVIILLTVVALIWILRDGFTVRNAGGFSMVSIHER